MKFEDLSQIVPHGELRELINDIHACHVGRIIRSEIPSQDGHAAREHIIIDLGDRGRLELAHSIENRSAWDVTRDLIGLPKDPSGAFVSRHLLSGEESRRELNAIELIHLVGAARDRISKERSSEYGALREIAVKVLCDKPVNGELKRWSAAEGSTPLICVTGALGFESRFESAGPVFCSTQGGVKFTLFRGFSIPEGFQRLEQSFFGAKDDSRGPGYACLTVEKPGRFGIVSTTLTKGTRTPILEALEELGIAA